LGQAGVSKVINGPIPYAPDGLPLLGPMPGVPNAFEACVFTFGIAQAGGAGKVLAEWITEGQTEWDMWSCDPRRYTDYTDRDYCIEKGMEVYGHEYAMHFPWHRWPAAPNRKQSALHSRLEQAGAQFGAYNGWERANYFAKPGDDTSEEATQTWARSGPWQPRIAAECAAVRDHAGMIAISGFTRLKVTGPGARAHVDRLTCSRLPQPGRVGLAYFPDTRGRILTEMSVIPESDEALLLITAGTAQWHDRDVLLQGAPEGITITDHSAEQDCLLLTGPQARAILEPLTDGDLALPWLTMQSALVCGVPCQLMRVSFAGELGWEIHCPADQAPVIWDALAAAGVTPFGMWALNSLRIEKGYRAWKGDLSTDYSILQGGLERFVDWSKPDFPGKAAMLAEKEAGPTRRFVLLHVQAGDCDAPYMSTLWHQGEIVGETTSGAWGYRVNHSVALGMVRADLAQPGTEIEVEIYGQRHSAVVQPDGPLWDPKNQRIRA
jgi:dimethylglycine dehydrogenase